ncbi:hypothetical protein [Tellurirhabdus bombi]|uniref:hypothetical protein n=1 Tax=Tellurirhabdus bombi TaxID=2907205 RepID=UPI001F3CE0EE|nr:hypothetical protein [Tellurirhabdus bombi]
MSKYYSTRTAKSISIRELKAKQPAPLDKDELYDKSYTESELSEAIRVLIKGGIIKGLTINKMPYIQLVRGANVK